MNHAALPVSMRQTDTPIQRLRNELEDTLDESEKVHATYAQEKEVLQDRILFLETKLAKERAENIEAI